MNRQNEVGDCHAGDKRGGIDAVGNTLNRAVQTEQSYSKDDEEVVVYSNLLYFLFFSRYLFWAIGLRVAHEAANDRTRWRSDNKSLSSI